MFTAKIFASLLLIAAAGVVDAERGRAGSADADATAATASAGASTSTAEASRIRAAVQAALASRVRDDLADPTIVVSLDASSLARPNGAIVAADGNARVSLGAGGLLPVHFQADWNPASGQVERIDYQVTGAATLPQRAAAAERPAARSPALAGALRSAIADKVGDALQAEFAGQSSRFELLGIERVDSGRNRMLVTGTGITRFDGEGAAFTRFRASLNKFDGRVLHVDYDLLQDVDPRSLAAR